MSIRSILENSRRFLCGNIRTEQNRYYFRMYTKYIVTIQYIYICHVWYMLHSDKLYACLRDDNSVCIFKRKRAHTHTHTHTHTYARTHTHTYVHKLTQTHNTTTTYTLSHTHKFDTGIHV